MKITETHKQFYLKGIEDFRTFFVQMLPEKDREAMINLTQAITSQLERNIDLIIKLNVNKEDLK